MRTSAFCFAGDLADEGVETVLDNIQGRAGLGGVTMAAAYHASRDLFPHAHSRRLRYQPGGEVFFRPDPARWRGLALQPRPSRLTRERDPLAELVAAADARGLGVQAWTVFLHVDWTEDGDPRFAEQTCFGDPCLTELCPANPDVRAYARALASDLAGRGIASVLAESLHHHLLEHGAHHERYFVELGAVARLLLGLCFCAHCLEGARRHGADPEELRWRARAEVERALAGDAAQSSAELSREQAGALLGGQLGALLESRCEVVTSLVGELAAATAEQAVRFELLDSSGAVKGYADGRPGGRRGALDRLAARHRRGRLRTRGRGDRCHRLRRRSRARGARPGGLPRACARGAAGRGDAPGASGLRFGRESRRQAARRERGRASIASTSTTTAWRR